LNGKKNCLWSDFAEKRLKTDQKWREDAKFTTYLEVMPENGV
jgi:hypothetical protein